MTQNDVRGPPGMNRRPDAGLEQGKSGPAQYSKQTAPVKFPQGSRSPRKPLAAPMSLYDGKLLVAVIQQRSAHHWDVFDRHGDHLGCFPTREAALSAANAESAA